MDASHAGWFGALFERFVDAIDRGEAVGRDALDALACVGAIEAAYASADAGGRPYALADRTPPSFAAAG
jgi:hypothetical protein